MLPLESTIVKQCSHLASTPTVPFQSFGPSSGSWPVPPAPGKAATVASRHGNRPIGNERLAPEKQEDTIRILSVDSLPRSPGPLLISRHSADVGRPILGNVVRAESVLTTHHTRNRRNADRASLSMDSHRITGNHKTYQAANTYR